MWHAWERDGGRLGQGTAHTPPPAVVLLTIPTPMGKALQSQLMKELLTLSYRTVARTPVRVLRGGLVAFPGSEEDTRRKDGSGK